LDFDELMLYGECETLFLKSMTIKETLVFISFIK